MNVFDLMAKIKLDTKEFDSALGGIPSKVGKMAGNVVKGTAKTAAALVGGAAAGVAALTKQSVSAYGAFEQFEGGIKTLYGDSEWAYQKMMNNAKNAYKTAGMSANEYMETAIESSGALIKALDGNTVAAAKYMDMAITDMADNANKMGTSIEDIQNAYRGFSRDNYTMLDNLALGYSGTADGMVELIKDSGLLGDAAKDLTAKNLKEKVSYDQIIEAIHLTQERMKIAGTTSKEAANTIEGSLRSTKSAWENLVTSLAMGDSKEMGRAMDGLVTAIVGDKEGEGLLNQLKPAITNAIKGVGELITRAAPIINEQLPVLMHEILPPLTEALKTLLETAIPVLAEMLPDLIATLAPVLIDSFITLVSALIKELPTIFAALKDALGKLFYAITDALDETFPGLGTMIVEIITNLRPMIPLLTALVGAWGAFKTAMKIMDTVNNVKKSIDKAGEFLGVFGGKLSSVGGALKAFGGWITGTAVPAIGAFLSAAAPVIGIIAGIAAAIGLVWAVVANWDSIKTFLHDFGDAFVEAWADILSGVGEFLSDLGTAFVEAWSDILGSVGDFFSGIGKFFSDFGTAFIEGWSDIFHSVGDAVESFKTAVGEKWDAIKTAASEKWEALKATASEKWNAITSTISGVIESAKTWLSDSWESIKSTAAEKWENLKSTASEKWESLKSTVSNKIETLKTALSTKWENIKATASEKWDALKTAIGDKAQAFYDKAVELGNKLRDGFKSVISKAAEWGRDFINNLVGGIEQNSSLVDQAMERVAASGKRKLGHSHPTEGPMKDDYKWMPDMMHLFADGIWNNLGLITDATDAMTMALQPEMPEYNATFSKSAVTAGMPALAGTGSSGGDIIIPVYLNNSVIDEHVITAQQLHDYMSGGR